MSKKFEKLTHIGFVIALLLLFCNDLYWKSAFHNAITGKLSDFAGLFAFPYFMSVVLNAPKKAIYVLTALGFMFWKSTCSEGFIEMWNTYFIEIQRVVDYSDLMALIILPVSYQYSLQKQTYQIRLHPIFFILLSCFAFGATSLPPTIHIPNQNIDKTYSFNCSKEELRNRIAETYTYNKDILYLIFSKYHITNVDINKKYFYGVARENHPVYATIEAEIKNPNQDTIRIRMARGVKTSIQSTFIISGDSASSSLHLGVLDLKLLPNEVFHKDIKREESYFAKKYLEIIERKFIKKIQKK